jgi:hypothetical protein
VTGAGSHLQVTQGSGLMTTSAHPPSVETVNVTVPGGNPFSYERVCTRSGSASLLNP